MAHSSQYKSSDYTNSKQSDYRHLFDVFARISSKVIKKHQWADNHFAVIDLFAGRGIDPTNGEHGSPLIALDILCQLDIPFNAYFYEIEEYRLELSENITQWVLSHNLRLDSTWAVFGDNRQAINHFEKYQGNKFGLIYADPSNAQFDIELINHLAEKLPRMEIILNVACTSIKRMKNYPQTKRLSEILASINKKHWVIREDMGQHQWSMIYGTNWNALSSKDMNNEKRYWHDIKTKKGQQLFNRLNYTTEELKAIIQQPLFELEDKE